MGVYQEVKLAVLEKKDLNSKKLCLLIVNNLLDEKTNDNSKFKQDLINLLINSDTTKEVQNTQTEINKIKYETFTIDVFCLQDIPNESIIRAKKVTELLKIKFPNYTIRLRTLTKETNNKSSN